MVLVIGTGSAYHRPMESETGYFETSSVTDFHLAAAGPGPEGYPRSSIPDTYSQCPFAATFEDRREAFVRHVLRNPSADTLKGFFYELVRIEYSSGPIHEGAISAALDYVDSRRDCADFVLTGILRMHLQFSGRPVLNPELAGRTKQTILAFKYWPDEPGEDSMCTWTENHQIIFGANEYLAGQAFPDEVFGNSGQTGRQKSERARGRILKWLEMRFLTGFSEWLSNVYYDEDLAPLLNLVEFAADDEIVRKAAMVCDLVFLDMAANHLHGLFACTHGRTYTAEKQSSLAESTTDTMKLAFGMGMFANRDNMSAVLLALGSRYRIPGVIASFAAETFPQGYINRQRVSIRFNEARRWGLGGRDVESAMGILLFGGYTHPRSINGFIGLLDAYRWWTNAFFREVIPFRPFIRIGRPLGLTNILAILLRRDLSRNTLDEANLYTWKTPEGMLSTAQDYHKGRGGDQHHIWQATLGAEAVCFTTHPGGYGDTAPNAYWHGSGFLPRAAQSGNVAIIVYRIPIVPTIMMRQILRFTHAWLPADRFDEVIERSGWILARKGDGYLALRSQRPAVWSDEGVNAGRELIARGRKNIWICQVGRRAEDGEFGDFTARIAGARLKFRGQSVVYDSPGCGRIRFGWWGRLRRSGRPESLKDYPRYDNPACRAEFAAERIAVSYNNRSLVLDLRRNLRFEEGTGEDSQGEGPKDAGAEPR